MKDIGLTNLKYFDDNNNSINTVGTSIGLKKIDDYNLIIVIVKNHKNEEWASNFLLGESGDVKGFDETSKLVINRIKSYIKANDLKKNKILITGYSRSGAISNLVGIYINEHLDEFETKKDDLYVYTFEAPNTSVSKKIYQNIHNVINYNDLVTYVYPKEMGFNLNGIVEDITTSNKQIMTSYFETEIKKKDEINKKKFLENFSKFLSNNITREEYTKVESDISDIVLLLKNMNSNELKNTINFFINAFHNYLYNENGKLNGTNGLNLLSLLNSKTDKEASKSLEKIKTYLESIDENSKYINLEEKLINIYFAFQKIIYNDYNMKLNNKNYSLYYTLTFIKNINKLIEEHYSDTIWKSVKNKDSYYSNGPGIEKDENKTLKMFTTLGLIIIITFSIICLIRINKNKKLINI